PIDLDNVLSVDSFVRLVRNRPSATLLEQFPPVDELCVRGPEGGFVHELLLPVVRAPAPVASSPRPTSSAPAVRRTFTPGSDWLYAKLYTGSATADSLLLDVVAPLARELLAADAVDSWFFIRYADPDWHLRVRF